MKIDLKEKKKEGKGIEGWQWSERGNKERKVREEMEKRNGKWQEKSIRVRKFQGEK